MKSEHSPSIHREREAALSDALPSCWEIAALCLLFYLHGGWPTPDVNEAYYVGKAVHFWNPDWVVGDTFLDSKDAHWFFYATFGSLSLFLSPPAMAWTGRLLAWFLLAISWRRLSYVLIPIRYFSVLTAAGMLYYLDAFTMSGEWIVGGVEGKSFAFPLVFFGLEAMLRGQWYRVWLFFGAASAFHVLVGGWSVVIGLFVLALEMVFQGKRGKEEKGKREDGGSGSLYFLPFFLVMGGLLSLPGLIPALKLDQGTTPEIASQAHYIYVYERLSHHLLPAGFPWTYQFRFAVLTLLWATISGIVIGKGRRVEGLKGRREEGEEPQKSLAFSSPPPLHPSSLLPFYRLTGFVFGSALLAVIGFVIAWVFQNEPKRAADLLRFYWFRMSDFAIPMGVSFASSILLVQIAKRYREPFLRLFSFSINPLGELKSLCFILLSLLAIGIVVFLALGGLIFGVLFPSSAVVPMFSDGLTSTLPPEPAIPWVLTLLLAIGVLLVVDRQGEIPAIAPAAWLLVLTTIVVWAPFHFYLGLAEQRVHPAYSRSDPVSARYAYWWTEACDWIKDPKNKIPPDARFLTPSESKNFKWNTRRPEVATWKEIPQDAKGIVRWYATVEQLYTYRPKNGPVRRDFSLQLLYSRYTPERMEKLQQKYKYDYILCGKYPALKLPVVYENQGYVIYKGRP